MSTTVIKALTAAGAIAAVTALTACGSTRTITVTVPASSPAATPATTSAPALPPSPSSSPGGTYQGACDYTLGNNPAGGTAMATGDVEITNTGTVTELMLVSITWPQQGYSPLALSRTVSVDGGKSLDVQFHLPLTGTQLSNLQNWQDGHNYEDGCTYDATLISAS